MKFGGQATCPAAHTESGIECAVENLSQHAARALLKDPKEGLAEAPTMTPEK